MPVQPPSGTVRFLLTDIEDSTGHWESMPADMTVAVRAHDVIVRSAIERHGGHVFVSGGDGFCAAFSSAVDAVTAAVDSQRELAGGGEFPPDSIPAVTSVVEATCTDAVRELGLIKDVPPMAPDASDTDRLMAQPGRSRPTSSSSSSPG